MLSLFALVIFGLELRENWFCTIAQGHCATPLLTSLFWFRFIGNWSFSGLDLKYGENGYLCWSAFALLLMFLAGGSIYAAVAVALIAGGKAGGVEPISVLLVSLVAARLIDSYFYRAPADAAHDVHVERRPYEEEIRDILFRNDPSKLHLVDAELDKFRGREKQLLHEYQRRYASPARSSNTGGGGSDATVGGEQKSVVQLAHEEETRRVQATIEASLQRINRRMERRRS